MSISHRRRGGEVLLRLLPLACSPVEVAEAEAAVADEGAHAEIRSHGKGLTLAPLGL